MIEDGCSYRRRRRRPTVGAALSDSRSRVVRTRSVLGGLGEVSRCDSCLDYVVSWGELVEESWTGTE